MTLLHINKPIQKRIIPLPSKSSHSWSTEDELDFLRRLGQHRPEEFTPLDHSLLIQRYRDSMALRADWQKMNPESIARLVEIRRKRGLV